MFEIIAKDFEKRAGEHKVDLTLKKNGDVLLEDYEYTCSYHQFKNDFENRLISHLMMFLDREGIMTIKQDYSYTDFKNDYDVKVNKLYDNPY